MKRSTKSSRAKVRQERSAARRPIDELHPEEPAHEAAGGFGTDDTSVRNTITSAPSAPSRAS